MREFLLQLTPHEHALVILLFGMVLAVGFELLTRRLLLSLVRRSSSRLDDELLGLIRHPVAISAILLSGIWAVTVANPPYWLLGFIESSLQTLLVGIWARVALRGGHLFLELVARSNDPSTLQIHPRSIPIFDFVLKLGVFAVAGYLVLTAWGIDVSDIATSFGLATVAVGFAAQESLSNLFAGVLIIADAPYQIGDVLVLDNGDRGTVVDIGIRSTRLLTKDDIEIIVPNNIMVNTRVINETGGPNRPCRVRVPIGVAYGVDLDHVKQVLQEGLTNIPGVLYQAPGKPPAVVLRQFGASSL
ncbi:MAG TPA: mechanosensitive ion channel protein, partial [Deltaproteobacteria bacterium]|nr:mechanosensitive ion channel protein [Deltaproteobacteria bacterium]